jgi:hypothetical protein
MLFGAKRNRAGNHKNLNLSKKQRQSEVVIKQAEWKLLQIARNADIFNSEAVKSYIANYAKKNGKPAKASFPRRI